MKLRDAIAKSYMKIALELLKKPIQHQRRKLRNVFVENFQIKKSGYCLDVGGPSGGFEDLCKFTNSVNLNLGLSHKIPGWQMIIADARNMPFANKSVDISYSSSLLEHVETGKLRVIKEIERISKIGYFVIVPCYFSPFEPHYMLPLFQFVPESVKRKLIFQLGVRIGHIDEKSYAPIKLFKKAELRMLCKDSNLILLSVAGLPMSLVAIRNTLT